MNTNKPDHQLGAGHELAAGVGRKGAAVETCMVDRWRWSTYTHWVLSAQSQLPHLSDMLLVELAWSETYGALRWLLCWIKKAGLLWCGEEPWPLPAASLYSRRGSGWQESGAKLRISGARGVHGSAAGTRPDGPRRPPSLSYPPHGRNNLPRSRHR